MFEREQQEERMRHWAWLELLRPQSMPAVTHFRQQDHAYSNKPTPPKSATFLFRPPQSIMVRKGEHTTGDLPLVQRGRSAGLLWISSFSSFCSVQRIQLIG